MNLIKRTLVTLLQLLLIAFLAFVAKEAWLTYQQEKMEVIFQKEGQPVNVLVTSVSQEKKNWKDYIGNSKYIGFSFNNKEYDLRILQDSRWVGTGSMLWLKYDPALDLFRQPGIEYHKIPNTNVSKLIDWSILNVFSYANRMLVATLALTALVLLLCLSVLANITGLRMLRLLADWFIIVCFLAGGVFVTWDAWRYYTYYNSLKTGSVELQVPLIEKHRTPFPKNNYNRNVLMYDYSATVRYLQAPRDISISSADYDRYAPEQALIVLYNAKLDDMVAADFTFPAWKGIFVVLTWLLIAYILKKQFTRHRAGYA